MYRCGVGLSPFKAVQGRESTSLCHGQRLDKGFIYINYVYKACNPTILNLSNHDIVKQTPDLEQLLTDLNLHRNVT
jgi:hypothetical protein